MAEKRLSVRARPPSVSRQECRSHSGPSRRDFRTRLRASITIAAIAGFATACGGLPPQPNIREEISHGIQGLGVVPFYPLQETPRIGELRLVNVSMADLKNVPSYLPTNVLLSVDLVPGFDAARKRTASLVARFPKSPAGLPTQLAPSMDKLAFYQQPSDPDSSKQEGGPTAPGGFTQSPPAPTPTPAATPSHAARVTTARTGATAKSKTQTSMPSGATASAPAALTLAGLASYKLASVDEFAAAGAWQSFLAALGLRKTRSLEIEAEGVEVADLPLDQVLATIGQECRDNKSLLANPRFGLLDEGYNILETYRQQLIESMHKSSAMAQMDVKPVFPQIYLLWRIYYLRGIRYIWNDSDTTAVLLEAAKPGPNASGGATPSAINNVTVAAPPPAPATGEVKNLDANIQALQAQLDSMTKAMAGSNAIALSYARATVRGIEFVSVFDRPLAFGYLPLAWNALKQVKKGDRDPNTGQPVKEDTIVFDRGLRKLCAETGVEP